MSPIRRKPRTSIVARAVVSRIIRIVLIAWLIVAGFALWQLR